MSSCHSAGSLQSIRTFSEGLPVLFVEYLIAIDLFVPLQSLFDRSIGGDVPQNSSAGARAVPLPTLRENSAVWLFALRLAGAKVN
jgi:hypothetical protein